MRRDVGVSEEQADVIYGIRGVPEPPIFGLRGTVPLTFQDENIIKEFAVTRGDLYV